VIYFAQDLIRMVQESPHPTAWLITGCVLFLVPLGYIAFIGYRLIIRRRA
jgi:hypothetical protein